MIKRLIFVVLLLLFCSSVFGAEYKTWNFTYSCDDTGYADDAYIRQNQPTTNYGTGATNYIGANVHGGLIKTPIRAKYLPDSLKLKAWWNPIIDSGRMVINCASTIGANDTAWIMVRTIRRNDWTETKVSWDSVAAGVAWTTPGAKNTTSDVFNDGPDTLKITNNSGVNGQMSGAASVCSLHVGKYFGTAYNSVLIDVADTGGDATFAPYFGADASESASAATQIRLFGKTDTSMIGRRDTTGLQATGVSFGNYIQGGTIKSFMTGYVIQVGLCYYSLFATGYNIRVCLYRVSDSSLVGSEEFTSTGAGLSVALDSVICDPGWEIKKDTLYYLMAESGSGYYVMTVPFLGDSVIGKSYSYSTCPEFSGMSNQKANAIPVIWGRVSTTEPTFGPENNLWNGVLWGPDGGSKRWGE